MARNLDDWIDGYLDYTSNTEPRKSYRTWAAISAIASVLQRKVWLPWGMETFYPNMYIVLVGPPAARKGTAMNPTQDFLNEIGIRTAADETSRQKLFTKLKDSYDMTTDDLGRTLNHSSLTIFSKELTVFLGYDNVEMLTVLCDWYDCKHRFEYDTFSHGKLEANNVWVNLFGATTPMLLQTSMPQAAIGSGFTSRTVFVFEEDKEKIVIYPGLSEEQLRIKEFLTRDLESIFSMRGEFRIVDDGFMEAYAEFREKGENNPPFREARLEYYLQRRHVHLLKLCMIVCASRSESKVITIEDFKRSKKILEYAESKMPYVFAGTGTNPLSSIQTQVMAYIANNKEVYAGDLMFKFRDEVTFRQMGEILAMLENSRFMAMNPHSKKITYIDKHKRKELESGCGESSTETN